MLLEYCSMQFSYLILIAPLVITNAWTLHVSNYDYFIHRLMNYVQVLAV